MSDTWKAKAIKATRGNQSRLGCLIIAMCGLVPKNPCRIRPVAYLPSGHTIGGMVIDRHDRCLVDMELHNGKGYLATCFGDVQEVQDNLRGLADATKMSDAERVAMFAELQRFIIRDFRATSGPLQ